MAARNGAVIWTIEEDKGPIAGPRASAAADALDEFDAHDPIAYEQVNRSSFGP